MMDLSRAVTLGIFSLGLALGAQAGPAQFTGSFIWHVRGRR
jgi:hypothetical protein